MEGLNNKIQEQKILLEELKSLKKDVKVYKQQQNSQIFFQTSKDKVFHESKVTLDRLIQEYKNVESTQEYTEDSEHR